MILYLQATAIEPRVKHSLRFGCFEFGCLGPRLWDLNGIDVYILGRCGVAVLAILQGEIKK